MKDGGLALGRYGLALAVAGCLTVRVAVSRWPYSGEGSGPHFGDFEAQRHWMEVTVGLPLRDWYRHDPEYWGLDYPPFTAYVSWACGWALGLFHEEGVALHSSRGFEEPHFRAAVRGMVVLMDALVSFPVILLAVKQGKSNLPPVSKGWSAEAFVLAAATLALMQPSQILIDHAHHQYNFICTGLALAAAVALHKGRMYMGSVLFCLSINFKQMALYYAPAFFFHLLSQVIATANPKRRALSVVTGVLLLGSVVMATFGLLWAPFCIAELSSGGDRTACLQGVAQVLARIFPLHRGVFEDKVASIWFCADVLFDLRSRFSTPALALLALGLTIVLIVPVATALFAAQRHKGPGTIGAKVPRPPWTVVQPLKTILLAMFTSSLAFYLASFHVHEKSILIPLAPLSLLWIEWPWFVTWFQFMAAMSIYPLMKREGSGVPLMVCALTHSLCALVAAPPSTTWQSAADGTRGQPLASVSRRLLKVCAVGSSAAILGLIVGEIFLDPPAHLPHLYAVLNAIVSCGAFCLSYLVGLAWLFDFLPGESDQSESRRMGE